MPKVIAVEGLDLVGKSTFIKKLMSALNSPTPETPTAVTFHEPWYEGDKLKTLRNFVVDPDLPKHIQRSIALGLRHELYLKKVIPALDAGLTVITDRSCVSTAVYQSDLIGSPLKIFNENEFVSKGYRHSFIPDVVVYLSISHDEYCRRLTMRAQSGKEIEKVEAALLNEDHYHRTQYNFNLVLNMLGMFDKTKILINCSVNDVVDLITKK